MARQSHSSHVAQENSCDRAVPQQSSLPHHSTLILPPPLHFLLCDLLAA